MRALPGPVRHGRHQGRVPRRRQARVHAVRRSVAEAPPGRARPSAPRCSATAW
jgi:hypothetical protein